MPAITYEHIVRLLQCHGTKNLYNLKRLELDGCNYFYGSGITMCMHTFKKLSVTGVPGTWETYVNSRSDL